MATTQAVAPAAVNTHLKSIPEHVVQDDSQSCIPFSVATAAFSGTNQVTDDIVAKSGFAGYFENVHPVQIELCISLIAESFRKLRCDLQRTKPGQKLRRIKATGHCQKQLDFCTGMLQDAGLIRSEGDELIRTDKPAPAKASKEILDQLLEEHPTVASLNNLIYLAGSQLGNIWSGRVDSVRAIIGDTNGRQYLEDVYGPAHPSKAFHMLIEDYVARLLKEVHPTETQKLQVLELGAGTGSTAKWLAPLLAASSLPVQYTFTDIGSGFVSQAARKFQEYTFMEYRAQDIEQPPPTELVGTQDVVIAVNAVHATRDIVQSLRNTRQYLKPGGVALIMEMQERLCCSDFIFGLFEGWWLFEDGREHAIAEDVFWKEAFLKAGFTHVDWTSGNLKDSGVQKVFMAINGGSAAS
ncbi:polyketide synthase [Colletotrichum sojae]|uniref:Polyketide synthase n=1 Tax=Colletotrichum sojae TaxID=2175907 RepID=A0A8H6MK64_9PEZI|nr:polyketide synthase [Colletotrichum sojae]